MLVNLKEILKDAGEKQYAVGMFDAFNIELARGIISAAEETKSPVIIGPAELLLPACPIDEVASFLVPMAKKASVPVVVHLDHGITPSVLNQAVDAGFTSVMFDGSTLPVEENERICAEAAKYAHAHGASLEGELGHVIFKTDGAGSSQYTDPRDVPPFVEKSGVDALAVAIGTAHGVYETTPVLDIGRLKEIHAVTDVDLVLHGGSGLSPEDQRACIAGGIRKFNVYTDLCLAGSNAAVEYVKEHTGALMEKMSVAMQDAIREKVMSYMRNFGCCGKA